MLDVLLSLDCGNRGVVMFIENEAFNAVLFGESWRESFAVLECAADQIIGDPDGQRSARLAGENVDAEISHIAIIADPLVIAKGWITGSGRFAAAR